MILRFQHHTCTISTSQIHICDSLNFSLPLAESHNSQSSLQSIGDEDNSNHCVEMLDTSHPSKSTRQICNIQSGSTDLELLTLLNINCRKNKIQDLKKISFQIQADIICLTETELKQEISSFKIFPEYLYFNIYRDNTRKAY